MPNTVCAAKNFEKHSLHKYGLLFSGFDTRPRHAQNRRRMPTILIIDKEDAIHDAFGSVLQPLGHKVTSCLKPAAALQTFDRAQPDVVIAAIEDGTLDVIRSIKDRAPRIKVIATAQTATRESALASLRAGACDFLIKPVAVKDFLESINRSLGLGDASAPASKNGAHAASIPVPLVLAGKSSEVRRLREQVEAVRISRFQPSILVQGPAGAGKRSLVRYLHQVRKGAHAPIQWINCPDDIALALPGSDGQPGQALRQADGGTLVLDGVDRLPADTQKALQAALDKIEERVFLLCISDSDLDEAISAGRFHIGFYFRIASKVIEVPALAKRLEEADALIAHLLATARAQGKAQAKTQPGADLAATLRQATRLDIIEQALLAALKESDGKTIADEVVGKHIARLEARAR